MPYVKLFPNPSLVLSFKQFMTLIHLSGINKTFYNAVFSKSRYWRRIGFGPVFGHVLPSSNFESIFCRVFTTDLIYHSENTITSLKLYDSKFATASTAMFVIDKFLVLEEFDLTNACLVDPKELNSLLLEWRDENKYHQYSNLP
jgi:hypothetical protein